MANTTDLARMVFSESAFATKLTWNPGPWGQPPLGGFATIFNNEPSTSAARTWLLVMARF